MQLKDQIYNKEVALLKSKNRASDTFIRANLTHDFKEFGSSGNVHHLHDVIQWLKSEKTFDFEISNFEINILDEAVILATYQIKMNSSLSLRSSIWILEANDWKMKFHQGTKVACS